MNIYYMNTNEVLNIKGPITLKARVGGVLYGQMVGDALGTRYEFSSSKVTRQKIYRDLTNEFLPILGRGPFNVEPGQVTDDTELAFGLLYSIIANRTYNKDAVAEKYIKWFNSQPFDVGSTTRKAFKFAKTYRDIVDNAQMSNEHSLSNGCLMRISPLGILGYKFDMATVKQYAELDCKMTNPHAVAIDAVCVYTLAIRELLRSGSKYNAYDTALTHSRTGVIKNCLWMAKTTGSDVSLADGSLAIIDGQTSGYLGVALQNAFYELLNGTDFYSSMCNVVSRGGDTDTNGCIVGALLGAYYGIDEIPQEWRYTVATCNNPRINQYPEINQQHINELSMILYDLIKKK